MNLISNINRRNFLSWTTSGIGGTALASLLMRDGVVRADPVPPDASDPPPHHRAKARRVIHICLCGGLSHLDSFDYKPKLAERHGKPLGDSEKPDVFFGKVGLLRKNDWEFKACGLASYFRTSPKWPTS